MHKIIQGENFFDGTTREQFLLSVAWLDRHEQPITTANALEKFGTPLVVEQSTDILGMAWYFLERKSYDIDTAVASHTAGVEQVFILSITFKRSEASLPIFAAYSAHTEDIPFTNQSLSTRPLMYATAAYFVITIARDQITKLINKTSDDIARQVLEKEKELLPKSPKQ